MASTRGISDIGFRGCEGEIVKDKDSEDAVVKLYGLPGTSVTVRLCTENYASATCEGVSVDALLGETGMNIVFDGEPITKHWHRKLADMESAQVPDDAVGLYEATVFSADNNALEVRCLDRSGPTSIPQVQAARDAFFNQDIFRERGLWDKNLFDDDPETFFAISRRHRDLRTGRRAALRLDFGEVLSLDQLVFETANSYNMQPLKNHEAVRAYVSTDLNDWTMVRGFAEFDITFDLDPESPIRYFKMVPGPERVNAVKGFRDGKLLDRSVWRASNLFAHEFKAEAAWKAGVQVDQVFAGSYLVVPVFGPHGPEAVYAAARCGDEYFGASRRAAAYPVNPFECPAAQGKNYSYFIPLEAHHAATEIEVFLLGNKDCAKQELTAEVWLTSYPTPHVSKTVTPELSSERNLNAMIWRSFRGGEW